MPKILRFLSGLLERVVNWRGKNAIKKADKACKFKNVECKNLNCRKKRCPYQHDINQKSNYYKSPKSVLTTETSELIIIPFRKYDPNTLKKCFGDRCFCGRIIGELELKHYKKLKGTRISRKTAWYTKPPCDCEYKYGYNFCVPPNQSLLDRPFFHQLWNLVETVTGHDFEGCNVSYYGDGEAWTPFHCDDENLFWQEEGDDFVIASVSLMCSREFQLKYKDSKLKKFSIFANPLDIVLMKGKFQWEFEHSIPPQNADETGPRINFTFRSIVSHNKQCPLW